MTWSCSENAQIAELAMPGQSSSHKLFDNYDSETIMAFTAYGLQCSTG